MKCECGRKDASICEVMGQHMDGTKVGEKPAPKPDRFRASMTRKDVER